MFRVMYKMGKVFADQPIPRTAADKIRRTMEKFKTHQALLNVICNPGIRERHWVTVRCIPLVEGEVQCCYGLTGVGLYLGDHYLIVQ